jgi:hypothetical protein
MNLFSMGPDISFSTAMVTAGAGVMVLVVFFVPSVILRQAAMRSKECLEEALAKDRIPKGMTKEKIRAKLKTMVFWPMKYPKPAKFLMITTLSLACFVFYRLTLLFVGYAIFHGIRSFMKTQRV